MLEDFIERLKKPETHIMIYTLEDAPPELEQLLGGKYWIHSKDFARVNGDAAKKAIIAELTKALKRETAYERN